ncbi:capsule biosynthesis protein [Humitalea sp. 24SJ18S-53]|uniref:capsular polysaccharide export protein, LipB/KpsS family n=1 Tax=Humitalea sp. 24SJ18S-53 TaxID=3422307 RepID=UPI003D677BE8
MSQPHIPPAKRFLFLQGPISPFFDLLGRALRARGHATFRINLAGGDGALWTAPGATDFVRAPAEWPGFIAAYLDTHAITDIVLLGEAREYHIVAIAAARARGVRIAVTDFGYIRPDWITLEHDGMNGATAFPRDPAAILRLAEPLGSPDLVVRYWDSFVNQAILDILYSLRTHLSWRFRAYTTHQLHHPLQIYLGMGLRLALRSIANRHAAKIMEDLRGQGPLFLLALQMETDFAIRAYSHYPDNDAVIEDVFASFAAHAPAEAHLLVKVHPLDPFAKNWSRRVRAAARRHGIAARVAYLGGGNLGDIVERCQGVVTVTSTVGLRAIVERLPTFALGDALYRIPGITSAGTLDAFWSNPQAPEPVLREAFVRAIAHFLHIRGAFYRNPGLDAAAYAAAERLSAGLPEYRSEVLTPRPA